MVGKIYLGAELEKSYAKILGGTVSGGFNDCGKDVVVHGTIAVQVRSSVPFALKFLQESLRRRRFIPICVGEPGKKEEMLSTLAQFGGWVGYDIPRRQEVLEGIQRVRELCGI
jgi:hypothetical protein